MTPAMSPAHWSRYSVYTGAGVLHHITSSGSGK